MSTELASQDANAFEYGRLPPLMVGAELLTDYIDDLATTDSGLATFLEVDQVSDHDLNSTDDGSLALAA